jgi:hypothetical protein
MTLAVQVTASQAKPKNPLFESKPKRFGLGNAPRPVKDLTRFVKWPEYVRTQRQLRVLKMRLKVPPGGHQICERLVKFFDSQALQRFWLSLARAKCRAALCQCLLALGACVSRLDSTGRHGIVYAQIKVHAWHAALNQFNKALDKNQASMLFKLLLKYQPEAKTEKRARLLKEAEAREAGKVSSSQQTAYVCRSSVETRFSALLSFSSSDQIMGLFCNQFRKCALELMMFSPDFFSPDFAWLCHGSV